MTDSPVHLILNDIRKKYSGKKCSMVDIHIIENKYNICSIMNTRNDGTAFLRITCFGLKQIMFEDICLDISNVSCNPERLHNYIFKINKALYEIAYGIKLEDSNEPLLKRHLKPDIDFYTMNNEIKSLKEKSAELEKKVQKINENDNKQISLF